jgi:hypothetical protein
MTTAETVVTYLSFFYETVTIISWVTLSYCLYKYCHTIKELVVCHKLNQVTALIHNSRRCDTRRQEFDVLRSISETQESFNKTFAVFPFLAFGLNIIQTAGYLFSSLNGNYELSVIERILYAIASIQFLLVPMAMCITAGSSKETRESAKAAIRLLERQNMSQCDIRLVLLIDRVVKHQDRGIMFEMSRHTIPVFAGHALSFAIMFMQLFNTKVKASS